MNREIRTAIATLATAFTVAVAIAPVASAAPVLPGPGVGAITTVAPTDGGGTIARTNNGKYSQSAEAKRKKFCSDLKSGYDDAKANHKRASWRGDKQAQKDLKNSLFGLKTLAEGNGCAWAQ